MKSYWIWNWGDWEIFHTNLINSRREQYGMDYPPFWKIYDVDRNVVFFSQRATSEGSLRLRLKGKGYIKIDGQMHPDDKEIAVKQGNHLFEIHVMNLTGLPAAFIESDTVPTDGSWLPSAEKGKKFP